MIEKLKLKTLQQNKDEQGVFEGYWDEEDQHFYEISRIQAKLNEIIEVLNKLTNGHN